MRRGRSQENNSYLQVLMQFFPSVPAGRQFVPQVHRVALEKTCPVGREKKRKKKRETTLL